MIHQPLMLRAAAAVTSSGAISESFTRWVGPRVFVVTLAGASILSLAALMQAAVSGRIDRTYVAMARAFIRHETAAPQAEPHGRHRLAVVRERGTGAPLRRVPA